MANTIDGNLNQPLAVGTPRRRYPIQNFNSLMLIDQDYAQLESKYTAPQLGIKHPIYPTAILAEETGHSTIGGGVIRFTRTFCRVPTATFQEPVAISYTFPGKKELNAFTREWQYNEEINGYVLVYNKKELQQTRNPTTRTKAGVREVKFIDLLDQANAETYRPTDPASEITTATPILYTIGSESQVVYPVEVTGNHFKIILNGTQYIIQFSSSNWAVIKELANGYSTAGLDLPEPFKILDAPRIFSNAPGFQDQNYTQETHNENPLYETPEVITEYLSPLTNPSLETYENEIVGTYIQTDQAQVEQFIGSIYKITTTKVVAI